MASYRGNDNRTTLDVTANLTLVKDTHSGIVINVKSDGKTITLPAAAAGLEFVIRNGGAPVSSGPSGTVSDGSVAVTIAPNGSDTIGGAGRSSANSSLVNTKSTSRVGDEVTLLAVSGAWEIVKQNGTWA